MQHPYFWTANQVVQVPLKALLSQVRPAYPQSHCWDDTFAYLTGDAIEKAVVDALVLAYQRDGGFREPVVVSDGFEFDGEDAVGLANGTHRVVASIIAGAETITVLCRPEQTHEEPLESQDIMVVTVTLPAGDMDIWEQVSQCLRSFPVNNTLWLECEHYGTSIDTVELIFTDDHGLTSKQLKQQCHRQLLARMGQRFPIAVVCTTEKDHWGEFY